MAPTLRSGMSSRYSTVTSPSSPSRCMASLASNSTSRSGGSRQGMPTGPCMGGGGPIMSAWAARERLSMWAAACSGGRRRISSLTSTSAFCTCSQVPLSWRGRGGGGWRR
jgi:hypothetical protein